VTNRIRNAAEGDRGAAAWLWERHRQLLYAMARDHRHDESRSGAVDTSDVVAETGVRFAEDSFFAGVKDHVHFRARLRQVIRGKAIDFRRQQALRHTEELHDDAHASSSAGIGFLNAEMNDLLEQLPLTLHKTALVFMERGNEREAAEHLDISRHELRIRLDQIRDELSKLLGGNDEP
jgi:RNA polymerase sigma factor (sigma-70 family)